MSGPNTTQIQVQTQTQIQELEAKKQKILEKITEQLLMGYWEGMDLENLIAAKLWGLKAYDSENEIVLERIIELGYGPEDVKVDRAWHYTWDHEAYEVILVLPNGAEKKIIVKPKKTVTTLTKKEYEKVKMEVEKYKERMKIKELEDEVRELQRELEWYKNEKKALENKLARLEEENKELNSMIDDVREFLIEKEIEEEFVEWLAKREFKEEYEQLKEEIKSKFFPNEYDDC